jgi:hypothetical protein
LSNRQLSFLGERRQSTARLGDQATLVKNQKTILANQGACKKNHSALNQILKKQKPILAAVKKK